MLDLQIGQKRLPSGETLLRDVSLAAGPREILALLGPSGVGKTTTLRILLGADSAFDGERRCTAARIGVLFQEPRLLPWRTVGDNIRLAIPRGMPKPDVAALLRSLGIGETAGFYPRQLSLGMARRAALARALAIAPDLLVLDEPFASLDPATATLIADRITFAARERGAAVIVAMHDPARAAAFATRIVVLAGRPATVAYAGTIPPDADRETIRTALVRDFPFLAHG